MNFPVYITAYKHKTARLIATTLLVGTTLLTVACGGSPAAPGNDPTPRATASASHGAGTPSEEPNSPDAPDYSGSDSGDQGGIDLSFGNDGLVTSDFGGGLEEIDDIAVLPDGKILAAGHTWKEGATGPRFSVARYDENGVLDETFGDAGIVRAAVAEEQFDYSEAHAIAVQPDGKFILVGTAHNPKMYHSTFGMVRFNANGTLDKTFGTGGKVLTPLDDITGFGHDQEAFAVALDEGGKIVVVGETAGYPTDFAVVRYDSKGKLDKKFGHAGIVTTDFGGDDSASAVTIQPDGKIVVAGKGVFNDNDYAVARYNLNGSLDKTFGDGGKATIDFLGGKDWPYGVHVTGDGKILLGGFAQFGAPQCGYYPEDDTVVTCDVYGPALARLNDDGTPDDTFGEEGKIISNFVSSASGYSMAVREDGKIALGGSIGNDDFVVAVYNPDGTIDESFAGGGAQRLDVGGTDRIYGMAFQADGKLVVGGQGVVDTKDLLNWDFALARYYVAP
ncbi:MAG: hypothetical protein QOH93_2822 [Chloroflexia bacterium]|jgi:uncharacterized delta-60 repeat protein|nr:hypothetical protein [Chloroflexia bacterium]